MISINELSFKYTGSNSFALKNINLNIQRGEFVGIIGPAGAGKSTLTLCLNGVIPHFQSGEFTGMLKINGTDTCTSSCASLACSVGSVFQDPESQIVASIVEEELAFGLENLNVPRSEMNSRIDEALRMVGITHLRYSSTTRLSGGQKQRVAIAAAIALKPKVLVLDEPTSELDPKGSTDVFDTLLKLNSQYNITIIIVEQKIQLLSEYCSRLVLLDKGNIVADGQTREILTNQELLMQMGVSCPPVTQLAHLLKKEGLYDGAFPTSVEEAFHIINKTLSLIKA